MRTELPVFKRCCFCLPLRYGLITWGYLKLSAAVIVSIALMFTIVDSVDIVIRHRNPYHIDNLVVISIVLVLLLTDVALNTVFLIGGHTKNVKLLRVYYIYNIVLWALTIALVLVMGFLMVPTVMPKRVLSYRAWLQSNPIQFASSIVNIIIQFYFVLLIRSEIIKLRSNCELRFVNNAGEAECTMKYTEGLLDDEKGMADVYEKEACERDVCGKICQINGTCHESQDRD